MAICLAAAGVAVVLPVSGCAALLALPWVFASLARDWSREGDVVMRSEVDEVTGRRDHLPTARELEIARAVAEGLSNAEIARRVFVSEATVKTHLGRAMDKVGVGSRVQLAVLVDRAGGVG